MTGISKYFNDMLSNSTCQDIVHPTSTNCFQQSFKAILLKGGVTNIQLFLPILLLPLAAKAKNLTFNDVVDALKSFGIATVQSVLNAQAVVMCLCLYYKVFGKYNYYTALFVPGAVGSLTNFILPSKLGQIHSNAFSSISLETGIRGIENSFINTLKKSKLAGTLCFMTFSSIIVYYLRLSKTSTYWHIQPLQFKEINKEETTPSPYLDKIINCESRVCVHNKSCDEYIITGIKTYAKYGLILDVIKILASRFKGLRTNPWNTIKLIFKKSDFMFFKFLTTYAGIYKLMSCLLNRYFENDSAKGTLLSGFISGGAYYLCPNYRFFTHGAVTAVQLFWTNFINSDGEINELMKSIPWRVVAYCLSLGYLLHMRALYPYLLPKFGIKVFDLTSAGKTIELEKRLSDLIFLGRRAV